MREIKDININPSQFVDDYIEELFAEYDSDEPERNEMQYNLYKIMNEEDILDDNGMLTINFKKELLLVQLMTNEFLYYELSNLNKGITQIDPSSFTIISNVHEVKGKGFSF